MANQSSDSVRSSTPAGGGGDDGSGKPPTILLVDDRPANLLALEAVLEPFGANLLRATSGEEALRLLLTNEVTCILMDVQMPGIDGFETARLIRNRPKSHHVPIIFVTATNRDEANILRGYVAGAVDYVVKPFSPDVLRAKVAAVLELEERQERAHGEAANLRAEVRAGEEHLAQARKEVLERTEAERARLYELFRQAPFPIVVLAGKELVVELINPAAHEVVGHQLQRGLKFDALGELEQLRIAEVRRAFDSGERQACPEIEQSEPSDDAPRYWSWIYQPTRDVSGAVDGVLLCGFEVTHEVRARLREAEAVRIRDEFLSVAAHELKTPLTPLLMRIQSMLRTTDGELPEHARKSIEAAHGHVQRLAKLVDGLLDVSRLTSGRLYLALEDEVDLSEVVREAFERQRPAALAAGCELTLELPHEPVRGRTDPTRLDQVLSNLLSNALKYGAGKPVHVGLRRADGRARILVRDQGIGISPEAVGRIFGKFERAVSERHYGGLGLGLYIARQITAALGGELMVTSEPGKGAEFVVEVPLAGPSVAAEPALDGDAERSL